MKPKSPKLLEDIRDAAAFVEEAGRGKTLEYYRGNRLLRQAIERNFEIIGEAVNRLTRHDPDTAARISNASQIVAFRNVLIHGCDVVDDARVWETVLKDIPALRVEVEQILRQKGVLP
jgi:uncharacterized protein with HEPN domain